ncbi:MAG: HD domain-containing protein [Syntrophomonas sp.]|uniref:HD-GYP domain-containing protein n=1 Tax=Syntrophomonas sp. TaxID=2053627 RepID=UPI0026196602|nr:HD domain-containing phosphohydrolase [Syntrophomonas sp.]MDD2511102.1 HD domain-containing protein [Syntrophomonas sp.]MDD3879194.1 HD domain-containing protein [Syntrophomonas sp.]MDD4625646.1 HD domain-containing protein [Syntrophomonas sp.]
MFIRTDITSLPLGRRLAQDIYSFDGQLLMSKGRVLQESHLQQLLQRGYDYIYILEDENKDDMHESQISEGSGFKSLTNEQLPKAFSTSVESMRQMMDRVSSGHMIKTDEVEECIDLIYDHVLQTYNVFKHLQDLRNKDEYTLQHSVSVGVLSIKIGQSLGLDADKLKNLGVAGILHDVGKSMISLDIINKPGPLDASEFQEVQKHPVYGYQIVNEIKLGDHNIAQAVLQHHEHQDGNGYPLGVRGDKINCFARIIAVADVFDALTSDRPYRSRMPLLQAADIIVKSSCGQLDPLASRRLISYILDITTGEKVILSTGEEATVILKNEVDPARPLVRIGERFLDLKTSRDIFIKGFVS